MIEITILVREEHHRRRHRRLNGVIGPFIERIARTVTDKIKVKLTDKQQVTVGPFTAEDADNQPIGLGGPVTLSGGTVPGAVPGSVINMVNITANSNPDGDPDGTFNVAASGLLLGSCEVVASDGISSLTYEFEVGAGAETQLIGPISDPVPIPSVPAPALNASAAEPATAETTGVPAGAPV